MSYTYSIPFVFLYLNYSLNQSTYIYIVGALLSALCSLDLHQIFSSRAICPGHCRTWLAVEGLDGLLLSVQRNFETLLDVI